VSQWAARKKLKISAEKSQVVLFTPNNREMKVEPKIFYEGVLIPVTNQMIYLGHNLNTMHTFTPHLDYSATKGRKPVRILKAVMGADFGLSKEDGLLTFKTLVVPVLGFEILSSCLCALLSNIRSLPCKQSKMLPLGQSQAVMLRLQSSTCMTSVKCCLFSSISQCSAGSFSLTPGSFIILLWTSPPDPQDQGQT
jgi:hypothetical protein